MTQLLEILRTAANKVLHDKAFNIAKNAKYDGYQRGLPPMVYKFFDKSLQVALLKVKLYQTKNQLKNYTNNYQKI